MSYKYSAFLDKGEKSIMKADPVKLLRLLGTTDIVFKIPVYQRNYEWNKEQVEQYFEDIERIVESNFKKTHFLGTIVFVSNEIGSLMEEKVLIDGQQRITTTILLLKAILDICKENKDIDINYESIYEKYLINKHASQKSRLKLKPVEADMYAFDELMMNNKTDSKIYENYSTLKEMLVNSVHSIEDIYKAMMYIDVVYISLDRDENPQVIFESLNSTGLSLTQADLIRNFILMGLGYEEQTSLYKRYWTKIEELLPNKIISEFVRDYLIMKEAKTPNKDKVYGAFKNYYFENKYDSEEILKELLTYARYYYYIINNSTGIKSIDKELENINNIRSTVTYPYLLELFDDFYRNKFIDEYELRDVLRVIVSYIYRRNICGIPTNSLNKIFAVMARETRKLRNNGYDYVDSVIDFLMSKTGNGIFPRDDEFKKNFINGDMYTKSYGIAKLVLYRIEEFRHKEVVNIDNLSVEHILPQELTPEWNIELGSKAYEIHNTYKNTIGNLTLTNYNSEMSNKSFSDKKKYYEESNIITTRDISKYERWTEESILDRAEKLFDIAKEVWKLPKDNYKSIGKERLLPNEEYSILDNVIVTGYTPKAIIFDGEKVSVNTWKSMLVETCRYLFELDEELFKSLMNKSNFKNILSYDKESLRSPEKVRQGIFVQTNYSAKDVLSYVVLFTEEFNISNLVYFEIS